MSCISLLSPGNAHIYSEEFFGKIVTCPQRVQTPYKE
jgi:hypothetical protein